MAGPSVALPVSLAGGTQTFWAVVFHARGKCLRMIFQQ